MSLMEEALSKHPLIADLMSSCARFEAGGPEGQIVWRCWGEGSPLLLLHGGSGSWLHWVRTIPALAQHFRVIVPDLPGCGESDSLEPPTLDVAFAAMKDGLAAIGCASPIDVVGFSFGSGMAVGLIDRGPVAARNIVLVGYNFMEGRPYLRSLVRFKSIADPQLRQDAVRANVRLMMLAHDASIDAMAMDIYEIDALRDRSRLHGASGAARSIIPRLALSGGFTAIYGAQDWLLGGEAQEREAGLGLLASRGDLVRIPDAGHWVMYEAADAFNALLLRRLRR